ncbi:MAG TPA: hypothetical protein VEK07_00220 [Polyangiaceae bacterium]|nr:hypothetical protein [Polyangiaceae bacterium]
MRIAVPRLAPRSAFYALVALLASAPAWIVKHPPLEDLPLHLATIRIIKSFHDPAFGFDRHFVLTLGRTQYVLYYLLGALLAIVVGVVAANVALVSAYLGGTVLAIRALLRALGRDERLSLFVLPLLINMMFVYGLFPFLLGIPIMFWALATAIGHFERPTLRRGVLLAALALALFYSHIFPFGIFCIGFAAMFPWTKPGRWLVSAAPVLPSIGVLAWWTLLTQAGQLASGAATDNETDPHWPIDVAIGEIPKWFTNVFRDTSDETTIVALAIVVVVALGLSLGDADRAKPVARTYVVLPAACMALYFVLPLSHGYIWLIAQRFPILFAMTAIPLLRMPRGLRGHAISAAALVVGAAGIVNTCRHFIRFETEEVGDVDDAIASMKPDRKVCALIYDKGSSIMDIQPFLHFGSYYQVEKGGVVMFTFAGYAHWPVDFRPGEYPPPGRPARQRWEWTPESVPIGEIYPYYDYVLTRGAGFRPPAGTFRSIFHNRHWTVWERD